MRSRRLLATILLGTCAIPAHATLIDRGNGMVYDEVLDVTWLSDANLGGLMNWIDSAAWADSLVFGGFDDWRLPLMDQNLDGTIVDCRSVSEADCRDNELGYMFYHSLMGSVGDNLSGDQGLFTDIQLFHWSGTQFAATPDRAWDFDFRNGNQFVVGVGNFSGAWAVRSGDVLAVPEPGTLALLGVGVTGIFVVMMGAWSFGIGCSEENSFFWAAEPPNKALHQTLDSATRLAAAKGTSAPSAAEFGR